jgi:hypothetical protein
MFLATSSGLMGASNVNVLKASLDLSWFCGDETTGWLGIGQVTSGCPPLVTGSPG